MDAIEVLMHTDFTPTTHQTVYPAISPTRPELSQAGRVVLITGGGTGIGKSIAHSFILAAAAHVIIVGRRVDVLHAAAAELEERAAAAGSPSQVLTYGVDVANKTEVAALFDSLKGKELGVDVLVLNHAKFALPTPFLELGTEELWSHMEANVRGPMLLTESFMKQHTGKQKFLINVTSAAIHTQHHPLVKTLAPYIISKAAATLFVQTLAEQTPQEELQVVTMHPGAVFGEGFKAFGLTEDMMPFDKAELAGAFAVWAASKEAAFVHNRVVWAKWDVEELARGDVRKRIEEDDDYLRLSVVGIKQTNRSTF